MRPLGGSSVSPICAQRGVEEQCTAALNHKHSAHDWADYVEVGARQIALEAVGQARVRDTDFYY